MDEPGFSGSAAGEPGAAARPNPVLDIVGDPDFLSPRQWRDRALEVCRKIPREGRRKILDGLTHGRKALVQELLRKAMEYGNADLDSRKRSPLDRALEVHPLREEEPRDRAGLPRRERGEDAPGAEQPVKEARRGSGVGSGTPRIYHLATEEER